MKRGLRNFLLLLCAGTAGWGAGEVVCRASWSRSAIGEILGRGQFLGVVRGRAMHERDLFAGTDGSAETMLAAEVLRRSSPESRIIVDGMEREIDLLRAQIGDEEAFAAALEAARLSEVALRAMVSDHLEVRHWIENQIAPELSVTAEECQQTYESNRAQFELPPRLRARHLFVAAPEGADAGTMLAKRTLAQALSVRLLAGESLATLAAEASEDEATKGAGGDLSYFSARRMPPDFMAEIEKLSVGQTSPPVRCHLGFHIIVLTEVKPARALTFAEARAEIAAQIVNGKRARSVTELTELIRRPEWSGVALRGQ